MGLLEQVLVTWDGAVALVTDTDTDRLFIYFVYLSGTNTLKGGTMGGGGTYPYIDGTHPSIDG